MLNEVEYIYSNPDSKRLNNKENLIPFINYEKPAPERCLDMLLAKYIGESYQSEVMMLTPERSPIPRLRCKLEEARILLITDGGLVPKGNPDKIPSTNAGHYGIYDISGKARLSRNDYEVSHQGYDTEYVEADPNRLLPVDVLREMEKKKIIGKLCDRFVSTTGVMTSTEKSKRLGKRIADYVLSLGVDAVIFTSACGTSTRCGAYIGKAIEEKGIPVVQVTNLVKISADVGIGRTVKGNNVCYPFGKPSLSKKCEYEYRKSLVEETLHALIEVQEKKKVSYLQY